MIEMSFFMFSPRSQDWYLAMYVNCGDQPGHMLKYGTYLISPHAATIWCITPPPPSWACGSNGMVTNGKAKG